MDIFSSLTPIKEVCLSAESGYPYDIVNEACPVVMRGFVKHWPSAQILRSDNKGAQKYILDHYNGTPVFYMQAPPECNGRLFYTDDLKGFNFTRGKASLNEVFDALNNDINESSAATRYVGSTRIDSVLPAFREHNDLTFLKGKALASIWMGNQSRIAAHYDAPDNIACIVHGKRRFTLFPPEQIDNLYIGPLDFTPAGQPASLVDFHEPDFKKYPKFKTALDAGQCATLEAGDAIFIPSSWWHHVEALDAFNVLVNYWWRQVDDHIGVPSDAMMHALMAIKSLPAPQRKAWKHFFDAYVFNPQPLDHIPAEALGMLGELDSIQTRKIRAMLLNKLNR